MATYRGVVMLSNLGGKVDISGLECHMSYAIQELELECTHLHVSTTAGLAVGAFTVKAAKDEDVCSLVKLFLGPNGGLGSVDVVNVRRGQGASKVPMNMWA